MAELTKKYLESEIETYKERLNQAEITLDIQNIWVSKGERVLNAYYEKCAILKRLIASPIIGAVSLVASTAGIIVLKEIIPGLTPFFILEGANVLVVGGATVSFMKNLGNYNYQKEQINNNHRYAPCEFHKLPNGELSAACHLEKDKEAKIRLEGVAQEYRNYIRGLERVYEKLIEEEILENQKQISGMELTKEKTEHFASMNIKKQLESEWQNYLEEISKLSPESVHLNDKEYLKEVEPIKLDFTPKREKSHNLAIK